MKPAVFFAVACSVALGFQALSPAAVAAERPNIILLLADDLGYGDLSCFSSPAVETPRLDRFANEGMRFTRFYAASAVCSPTRASVLTGRYPLRFGITRHFNDVNRWLPESATTVAELLAASGYNTAHVGKWHLGGLHVDENGQRREDQPGPRQHGFGFYQTQIEQQPIRGRMGRNQTLYREGGTVLLRNDKRVGKDNPYYSKHLTDANGDFSVELIERLAAQDKPFFLNVWWLVPHKPYEPAPEPHWTATKADGISEAQHRFRSMVRHMDTKIGQILDKLDELNIAQNTLVLFTSDNGAAYEGYIGDLKGGKTDLHEGGIRVPMLVRWPAAIAPGKTSDAFGHTNDLLPTFCAAAGVELPSELAIDGLSLLPHLKGERPPSDEQRGTVFWQLDLYRGIQRHYPKPKPYATEVAKRGKWKLLALHGKPVELFDIEADPNEQRNVLEEHPQLVASLTAQLTHWLNDTPTPEKKPRKRPPKQSPAKSKAVTHSFIAFGRQTYIVDGAGNKTWTYPHATRDGYVLADGRKILTLNKGKRYPGGAVIEVSPAGKESLIWKGTQAEVNSAHPTDSGTFVITEAGAKPRLLEVDQTGKVLVEFPLQCQTKNHHLQTRMARKLPTGSYLVPHLLDFAVLNYDAKGKVTSKLDTTVPGDTKREIHSWPFTAIRHGAGHTLVCCTNGNRVVDFDSSGKVVWELTNDDLPGPWLQDPCGGQVLPNGNIVVACYAGGRKDPKAPKLFEVTRDKDVIWTYRDGQKVGIHHFQILDTNGEKLAESPLK